MGLTGWWYRVWPWKGQVGALESNTLWGAQGRQQRLGPELRFWRQKGLCLNSNLFSFCAVGCWESYPTSLSLGFPLSRKGAPDNLPQRLKAPLHGKCLGRSGSWVSIRFFSSPPTPLSGQM